MTPEQRETLAQELERVQLALRAFPRALGHHELADALRAALTERTCGTCRHGVDGVCRNLDSMHDDYRQFNPDDGCIKGWEPRRTGRA